MLPETWLPVALGAPARVPLPARCHDVLVRNSAFVIQRQNPYTGAAGEIVFVPKAPVK